MAQNLSMETEPWCVQRHVFAFGNNGKVRRETVPADGKHQEVFGPREAFQNCLSEGNTQSHM